MDKKNEVPKLEYYGVNGEKLLFRQKNNWDNKASLTIKEKHVLNEIKIRLKEGQEYNLAEVLREARTLINH